MTQKNNTQQRAKNFLAIFYRLAQIDFLTEAEIFMCTRLYGLKKNTFDLKKLTTLLSADLHAIDIDNCVQSLIKKGMLTREHDNRLRISAKFQKRFSILDKA